MSIPWSIFFVSSPMTRGFVSQYVPLHVFYAPLLILTLFCSPEPFPQPFPSGATPLALFNTNYCLIPPRKRQQLRHAPRPTELLPVRRGSETIESFDRRLRASCTIPVNSTM